MIAFNLKFEINVFLLFPFHFFPISTSWVSEEGVWCTNEKAALV